MLIERTTVRRRRHGVLCLYCSSFCTTTTTLLYYFSALWYIRQQKQQTRTPPCYIHYLYNTAQSRMCCIVYMCMLMEVLIVQQNSISCDDVRNKRCRQRGNARKTSSKIKTKSSSFLLFSSNGQHIIRLLRVYARFIIIIICELQLN